MQYKLALEIAQKIVSELAPHSERLEIAGSIRRKKPEVGDIEVVCIPKPYETGLFESGIACVVNKWGKVKGTLPCKYTQRMLPEGIKLDLFFAEEGNWGNIFVIRTGSAEYVKMIANRWVWWGYKGKDGYLHREGNKYGCKEEKDLFDMLGLEMPEPHLRNII